MNKVLALVVLSATLLFAQESEVEWYLPVSQGYEPSPENLEAREWFRDAGFGLFIHWGVYSLLEKGEWVMHRDSMTVEEYEKLPPQFNPVNYDPEAIVALAKKAGVKYITITSKHHDGFAMWDSEVSDYDIVDATPYGKDVLKMLAEACEKEGIKLIFYHSHLDWHHPDYYPRGKTGRHSGRPDEGDFNAYLDYMDAQLAELLSGEYGEVAGIWFDGYWDQTTANVTKVTGVEYNAPLGATQIDWRLNKTYDLIHGLQPAALIANNHHISTFEGEDYQAFEKDLPGANTTGWAEGQEISSLPLEMCETINHSWGYNKQDSEYKSVGELIGLLAKGASYGANLLLNIGPKPDGSVQQEFVDRLEAVGRWMDVNGEAVYATRPWKVRESDGVVYTMAKKGGVVYAVLLEDGNDVSLDGVAAGTVEAIELLGGGTVSWNDVDGVPAVGETGETSLTGPEAGIKVLKITLL